jgi:hypothetical protein
VPLASKTLRFLFKTGASISAAQSLMVFIKDYYWKGMVVEAPFAMTEISQ